MRWLIALALAAQFAGGGRLSGVNIVTTITVPTTASTYDAGSAGTLTVSGTAVSDRLIARCTWTNSLGGSGTAALSGPTSQAWTVASLALTTGSNVVTVTCFNTEGTSTADIITITRTTVLYVDNASGHNCSDTPSAGSAANPFCTVSYGVSHMSAGTTLYTRAGTYAGDFSITGPSGTVSAHTVISAYPGETAILTGPGINSGRMKITGGCSYIDFVGFVITAHNQGLYLDDDFGTSTACTNVVVDGITIHDVGQEGLAIREGAGTFPLNDVIKNSLIYNTGLRGTSSNGEGMYIGNSSGTDNTNTVTILTNTVHDAQDECIELKGDSHDIIVDGNTLYNCLTPGSAFGSTGGAIEVDEPRNSVTNPHQIVRNNIIHDIAATVGIVKRAIRMGTGTTAYNNVIYNINSGSTCVLSNSANYPRVLYQNTIDCTTANAVVNSGTSLDSQNNLGPATSGNNRAITSSDFVNYSGHDYRLVTGSPALNVGANLNATAPTDILGVTRANPPDLGAYEGAFSGSCTTVASLVTATVQAAINAAASGSCVQLPAGTATWASTITISGKALTFKGSGEGVTNITDGAGGALNVTANATNFVSVSAMTFTASTAGSNASIVEFNSSTGTLAEVGFRLHNVTINNNVSGIRSITVNTTYGLIDHLTVTVGSSATGNQVLRVNGSSLGSDGGYTPWSRPLTLGTNKAVYLEDSTFTYPVGAPLVEDSIDAYAGARFVIRHSTFNSTSIGWHGLDSGGLRSPVSFEVYENSFHNNSGSTLRGATIRGGAGVFFNNTNDGSHAWSGYGLYLYRVTDPTQCDSWKCCDGTTLAIGSTSFSANLSRCAAAQGTTISGCFGSSGPANVGFSSVDRESVGTFGTGNFTTYLDTATANGYQCRDQPGVQPGQTVYGVWANNNGAITLSAATITVDPSAYLQSGRDFFNGSLPGGYTAYTYPHPLQSGP